MASASTTEDYYKVLEVEQTATLEVITKSYRRLALERHPDRNKKSDATEVFQQLGRAYETLKDEDKRREYDRCIYPFITRGRSSHSQPQAPSEAAQIAIIREAKSQRASQWHLKQNVIDSAIFELQRKMRRLEQEISNLQSIQDAEAAEEANKNSWGTWLLSPFYTKAEVSEDAKARKDRERQERRIEKDIKERRLAAQKSDLDRQNTLLRTGREQFDAADRVDEARIWSLEARLRERENQERRERERLERERVAKMQQQQREQREKQAREAAEARRKQQQEEWDAAQRANEEAKRNFDYLRTGFRRDSHFSPYETTSSTTFSPSCLHESWWLEVPGRANCPRCHDSWAYLLQCPDCATMACPKCKADIRPRRKAARWNRRQQQRVRTPSPRFGYYEDWM